MDHFFKVLRIGRIIKNEILSCLIEWSLKVLLKLKILFNWPHIYSIESDKILKCLAFVNCSIKRTVLYILKRHY